MANFVPVFPVLTNFGEVLHTVSGMGKCEVAYKYLVCLLMT